MLLFSGLQVEAAGKRMLLRKERKEGWEHLVSRKQRWMLLSNLQQGSI